MFSEDAFLRSYLEELTKVASEDRRSVDDAARWKARELDAESRETPPSVGKTTALSGLGFGAAGAGLGALVKGNRLKGALIGGLGLGGLGALVGYITSKDKKFNIENAKAIMKLPKADRQALLRSAVREDKEQRIQDNRMDMINAAGIAGRRLVHGY